MLKVSIKNRKRVAAKKRATTGKRRRRQISLAVAILVLLCSAAAAWKWTPLSEQIDLRRLTGWAFSLRDNPARPVIVLGAYLVGSLIMVPITVLILATALVFGPVLGTVYSLVGCFLGAAVTYAVGYFLGRDFIKQITGPKWKHIEDKIGRVGIIAVATLRLLPVAPFTIVNVISGAFQVPIRDYIIGSLLGLMPGIVVINLFAHQTESAIRNPGWGSYVVLGALAVVSVFGTMWLRKRLAASRA